MDEKASEGDGEKTQVPKEEEEEKEISTASQQETLNPEGLKVKVEGEVVQAQENVDLPSDEKPGEMDLPPPDECKTEDCDEDSDSSDR